MGRKETTNEPTVTALDNLGHSSDSASTSDASTNKPLNSSVFISGGSVDHYEPIPEYEGRHRYDPTAQWTPQEEKVLVKKV